MLTLYPHQTDYVNQLRTALATNQSVLAQGQTGVGKTVIASYIAKGATAKGKSTIFTVHRRDLLTQTAKTFDKFDIPYAFIAAGYRPDPYQPVQIASINTLRNRLSVYGAPDLLVIDEAHLSAAKGWATLIEHYKQAGSKIIGLTATPWRLSGEGLDHLYDTMVLGPTTQWLIENKYLSDYKLYAPSRPDLTGVHSKMGDYINAELETVMDNSTITGNAITHYQRYAMGMRALCFCISIKHSRHVAEQFKAQGIMAVHIDGETPHADRMREFVRFANGEVKVITSVQIFSEGFDLSAQIDREVPVEAVILLRPTQSLTLYLQQVGRALRRKPEPAIILDHAGNTMRHSLPDDDREWTLEGNPRRGSRKKEVEAVNIRQCPQCFRVHKPNLLACPGCGHVYVAVGRMPDEKEGELVEVDKEAQRAEHKEKMVKRGWLIRKAKCYEDFKAIEKTYGYKRGWARVNYNLRKGKRGVV